jgi:signal transduction histidine kinase/ActR/RegA family two-component response regulator
MIRSLLVLAFVLQAIAVAYGVVLLTKRRAAANAWLFLLGAMLSMLAWRLFVMTGRQPSPEFNLVIAIWGSTCILAAMYFFGREVARRQAAEAERNALLTSERAARREAELANEVKDEFLATLSHELRTPLTAILGWSAVLKMRSDPREVERGLDIIERNARTQARLVDDLLDATRIQAGKLQLDLALIRLDGPVAAAVEAIRPAAEQKEVVVQFDPHDEGPVVYADSVRLQQIAGNLLVNAVKFTPEGGIVTVSTGTNGSQAVLTVRDTGEGINPEFLPHLFTRFRQADRFTGRRHGGLGLGLSIVANLVRLHGGTVQAASPGPGRGATFTVTLPVAAELPATPPTLKEHPQSGVGLTDSLAGVRVLVVDDDPDVRSTLVRLIEELAGKVVALESGVAVENTLRATKPDILLIDISMPGEDGYTLIRRIRRLAPADGGTTPAISLTAHARNEDRARALDSGFQDHQPKPIDVPSLVASIRALVPVVPSPGSQLAISSSSGSTSSSSS